MYLTGENPKRKSLKIKLNANKNTPISRDAFEKEHHCLGAGLLSQDRVGSKYHRC